MKQHGLALHNYHDTHGKFPYSVLASGLIASGPAQPAAGEMRNHRGWPMLLPFIEQAALYESFNFSLATANCTHGSGSTASGPLPGSPGNANDVAVSTVVPAFLCPSDPNPTNLSTTDANYAISPGTTSLQGAFTNYDFNIQRSSSSDGKWNQEPQSSRRLFGLDDCSRIRDILDGTSNTVAVCETLRKTYDGRSSTWGYAHWVGHGVDLSSSYGINSNTCCTWQTPPNTHYAPNQLGEWSLTGSMHPGGAQFTFADGSVHFISETVNLLTRQRLSYISDGQVVPEY